MSPLDSLFCLLNFLFPNLYLTQSLILSASFILSRVPWLILLDFSILLLRKNFTQWHFQVYHEISSHLFSQLFPRKAKSFLLLRWTKLSSSTLNLILICLLRILLLIIFHFHNKFLPTLQHQSVLYVCKSLSSISPSKIKTKHSKTLEKHLLRLGDSSLPPCFTMPFFQPPSFPEYISWNNDYVHMFLPHFNSYTLVKGTSCQ